MTVEIGRVFHYTPLVEDLPAAEAFYNTFFGPHCFYPVSYTHLTLPTILRV